jgi:anti-sigma-K factor RskA
MTTGKTLQSLARTGLDSTSWTRPATLAAVIVVCLVIVHRLRLVFRVSVVAVVCMLSTHQTKINTFTQKDVEVSQNSRFANENAGKKDCGFFG